MNIHILSGFLGSGKTTSVKRACEMLLEQDQKVAVITNDQGAHLVDGFVFKHMNVPERQVGNGCFCCNYDALDGQIDYLVNEYQPEHLFAETVGTCTDIVATVIKPMQKYKKPQRITFTTVADCRLFYTMISNASQFAEEVRYIYFKQLEEAEVILLTKTDLVDEHTIRMLKEYIRIHLGGKQVLQQNNLSDPMEKDWLQYLLLPDTGVPQLASLQIDYNIYGEGEALMGYLDMQLRIKSENGDAEVAAISLMKNFVDQVNRNGLSVGHIKYWLNDRIKISHTATSADQAETLSPEPADACTLIINARVQCNPEKLSLFIDEAMKHTQSKYGVMISVGDAASFKPGFPQPLYRIE